MPDAGRPDMMSSSTRASSTEACAHLHVGWRTQPAGNGTTRGWWACDLCEVPFRPLPPIPVLGEPLPRDDDRAYDDIAAGVLTDLELRGITLEPDVRWHEAKAVVVAALRTLVRYIHAKDIHAEDSGKRRRRPRSFSPTRIPM